MQYRYPEYKVDLTPNTLAVCRDLGQRLLEEVGLEIQHEEFVNAVRGHTGVRVSGDRVYLSRALTDRYFEDYIAENRRKLESAPPPPADMPWSLSCNGFSIAVIDIETDEVRPATCRDLHDLIKLYHSLGLSGSYPVTPQDVPPLMRALACFKICWQDSDRVRPFDYMHVRQLPYLHEMHRVMQEPLAITINVTKAMGVSEHDLDVFMRYYPCWKRNRKEISWYSLCDYAQLGISKPITSTGCLASYLSQSFGLHILFRLFDPELFIAPRLSPGMPTDLRQMSWAFGSPRMHLYSFLAERAMPALCGLTPDLYAPASGCMWTGSCSIDARSGMEKMATTLTAALQGARSFSGAGNLAIDDLFSGVQLILDVEIFEYVKELIEAFDPSPDLLTTEGVYEVLRDVGLRREEFYSHPDTAGKVRSLLPASDRRPHEKLRAWMVHRQDMKDRLRQEALDRVRQQEPFVLESERYEALERIYKKAETELTE